MPEHSVARAATLGLIRRAVLMTALSNWLIHLDNDGHVGSADDPMRAIQSMPGATAGDEFQAQFSLRGAGYNRICPGAAEADFHAAYADGHTLYVATNDVAQIEPTDGE